jgi:hypothetical protein
MLVDPMFYYWTLTGDQRIPDMVLRWLDFLDRKGLQPPRLATPRGQLSRYGAGAVCARCAVCALG